MQRQKIDSSHIASVGFDPQTGAMEIEFSNGNIGTHANVTQEKFDAFMASDSKGSAYHKMFRGSEDHPYTRQGREEDQL